MKKDKYFKNEVEQKFIRIMFLTIFYLKIVSLLPLKHICSDISIEL